MNDVELYGRACALARKVKTAKYPVMVPAVARETIQEAAALIEQLAEREVMRCREQQTTAKQ
jgi:hypothetical protein